MHKNSHIARTFSTFLMFLMLMFTVFGKTFSASQRVNAGEKSVKTTQTDKQKQDPRACSVSELSVMQASTPISVDFSPEFTFTPQLISFVAPTLHSEVVKEQFIVFLSTKFSSSISSLPTPRDFFLVGFGFML